MMFHLEESRALVLFRRMEQKSECMVRMAFLRKIDTIRITEIPNITRMYHTTMIGVTIKKESGSQEILIHHRQVP